MGSPSKNAKPAPSSLYFLLLAAEPWMPRELGRIKVSHAGFVEIFDTETGGKDLYITTFNAALPFFHDPVFFLKNPGDFLNSVNSWNDELQTLGSKIELFDTSNGEQGTRKPINIAAGQDHN